MLSSGSQHLNSSVVPCDYNQLCVLVWVCCTALDLPVNRKRLLLTWKVLCYPFLPGNTNPVNPDAFKVVFLHVIPLSLFPCTRKDVRVILERIQRPEEGTLGRRWLTTVWFVLPHLHSFCKVWVKLVQFRQILGLDGGCEAGFRLTWHLKGPAVLLTVHL